MVIGLISCFSGDWLPGFCDEKTIEFFISLIVAVVVVAQVIVYIRRDGCALRSRYVILLQILLSLVNNCIYCMDHKIHVFYFVQTFFFNIYFVSIVYYITMKLLNQYEDLDNRLAKSFANILYGLFVIFYIGAMIDSILSPSKRCQQLWLILIRIANIILASVLLMMGFVYQRKQQQKLISFSSIRIKNNQMGKLWVWIGFNIIATMANIIQSVVFYFNAQDYCEFDKNNIRINYLITCIMVIFTYELPFISTVYIFWVPFREEVRSTREDSVDANAGIEITLKRTISQNL